MHHIGICDLDDHFVLQAQELISIRHSVADIEPYPDLRVGQDRTVFNDCPAVDAAVSFDAAATSD